MFHFGVKIDLFIKSNGWVQGNIAFMTCSVIKSDIVLQSMSYAW